MIFYSQKSWICEMAYIPYKCWCTDIFFYLLSYPLYLNSSSYTSLFPIPQTYLAHLHSETFHLCSLSLYHSCHQISTLFSLISFGLFATFPVKPFLIILFKTIPLNLSNFSHRNCHHLTAVHLTYFIYFFPYH